jgi:hypothetical protein
VTRNGQPITDHGIRGGVNTGIGYSPYYEGLTAAIGAGATLNELEKWIDGDYSPHFMAVIIAWNRTKHLISNHTEDAVSRAAKNKSRK